MSNRARKDDDPAKRIRVAIVEGAIAPYAVPEGDRLASRPEIITKHFFAARTEPCRQWEIPRVPFPHEITAGFAIRLKQSILFLPLMLPVGLFKFKPDVIVGGQLGTITLFTYLYAIPARVPVLIVWEGTPHTEAHADSGAR